jgi:protein ImuA
LVAGVNLTPLLSLPLSGGGDDGSTIAPARIAPDTGTRERRIGELRQKIAALEKGGKAAFRLASGTDVGRPAAEGLFEGAFPPALHVVRSQETRSGGAVAGFVAAMLAAGRGNPAGPVLWIVERAAAEEVGRLAPHGLLSLGLDPSRVLAVEAPAAADVLWALEEGLAHRGLAAVVGELYRLPRAFDDTASRRLSLRAQRIRAPAFLILHGAPAESFAAASRWSVSGRPSRDLAGFAEGLGRPALRASLEKTREGRPASFDVEWDHHERAFAPLSTRRPSLLVRPLPGAGAAAPFDRPGEAGGELRKAS